MSLSDIHIPAVELEKGSSVSNIVVGQDVEAGDLKHSDPAEQFLQDNEFTPVHVETLLEDRDRMNKLVTKTDLIILPLLMGTYMLQYIDKQALSYAAVFDLLTDTGMNGSEYGLMATWFYFGYLVAEYPWSALAQRTSVSRVVGGCVVIWGCILMLTAACKNYQGLAACRFFLGVFEAPITPCFMMVIGMWYTRDQQPFRAGLFYCCNGVGSMVGGVLTYAVGQEKTFPVWKAIFLLCGGATVLWGFVLIVYLPGDILSSKRFSPTEKAMLIGRGRAAQTGILNKTIKWYQIRECFMDPQVWILFFFTLLNEVINGGVANFGKLIIKGVVSDSLSTVVYGIPSGAFQVFYILTGTYLSSRFRNCRTIVMAVYIVPTIIGSALLWQLPRTNKYGLLLGYYIIGSFVASLVLALQLPASNLGGYTKRVTATAFVFLAYCVGNMIGPQAFLASESPTYPTGCIVVLSCACGQIVLAIGLRMLLIFRNKTRDAQSVEVGGGSEPVEINDLTDFENPNFRYVY